MKHSLVLVVSGPEAKDVGIFVTDKPYFQIKDGESCQWWNVGLVQRMVFTANANNPLPSFSFNILGLTLTKTEKPDLSNISIFISDFISIEEKPTIPGAIYLLLNGVPMACAQSVRLDVDVAGETHLDLEGIESKYFEKLNDMQAWIAQLPPWVMIKRKNIDHLYELRTDGVIDTIECGDKLNDGNNKI